MLASKGSKENCTLLVEMQNAKVKHTFMYNSAIPLTSILSKWIKKCEICMCLYIATIFTGAKTQEQLKCT